MSEKYIIFCDTSNKIVDEEYAELVRAEFRKQTGWKVAKDTLIWNHLTDFSKGYSVKKRDPCEVVAIFRIASGIAEMKDL